MYALIVAATLCLVPRTPVVQDEVDVIEVNHYFDAKGCLVFDQVIFWKWNEWDREFHVIAWRFLKAPGQIPIRNWRNGQYHTIWHDGSVLRHVRSQAFRETWTQFDPEVEDRNYVSRQARENLTGRQPP